MFVDIWIDRCVGDPRMKTVAPLLRPHQVVAIDAVRMQFAGGKRSTLLVQATGTGKTVTFAEIARMANADGKRVLVLAHRGELVDQAVEKLRAVGIAPGVEMGAIRAGQEMVVVATVQSLKGKRLEQWPANAFGLIVVDEAHRSPARGYEAIFRRFVNANVLGVTATPDRLDGTGLESVFESVAFRYDLHEAIRDGCLVPLSAQRINVGSVDLSRVGVHAGDFAISELGAAMNDAASILGVAVPLLELAGQRKTIVFSVDVHHAHALAEALNNRRSGCARAVDGGAPTTTRRAILEAFRGGEFQFLVNCALYTEGFDEPSVACVAVARPTKSRALYAQMVGRGTRLYPGKVDCLILDFVGNAGRHRLMGPADALAGRDGLSQEERQYIENALSIEQRSVDEVIAEAAAAIAEMRRRVAREAIVTYQARHVDPFLGKHLAALAMARTPPQCELVFTPRSTRQEYEAATEAQLTKLQSCGLESPPLGLSRQTASEWLEAFERRQSDGFCTMRQAIQLRSFGHRNPEDLSFQDASRLIEVQRRNGGR